MHQESTNVPSSPVVEVKIRLASRVHFKVVPIHQCGVHPPVCLSHDMTWDRDHFVSISSCLVPKSLLDNAFYTGQTEHQSEEVIDCHSVLGVG